MGSKADRRTGVVASLRYGATTVADITAPTVAELTALTDFTCDVIGDTPFSRTRSGQTTDISGLCEPGTYPLPTIQVNEPITFMVYRHPAATTDDTLALFDDADNQSVRYLAVAAAGFSGTVDATNPTGAPVAGDKVDMYEVRIIVRSLDDIQKTERQGIAVELAPSQIAVEATVAA